MSDVQFPPGWHVVPGTTQERYWDGTKWTNAYRDVSSVASYAAPPSPGTSGQAIASMVLGIVSLVLWYVGIVTGIVGLCLGVVALKKVQPNGPQKGRGMAIAGISCSIVALSLWLIVLIAFAVVSGS